MYCRDDPYNFEIPKEKVEVALPPEHAMELQKLTLKVMAKIEEKNLTGFRLQRQFQTLTMANALIMGRAMVTKEDVRLMKELAEVINYDFNPL